MLACLLVLLFVCNYVRWIGRLVVSLIGLSLKDCVVCLSACRCICFFVRLSAFICSFASLLVGLFVLSCLYVSLLMPSVSVGCHALCHVGTEGVPVSMVSSTHGIAPCDDYYCTGVISTKHEEYLCNVCCQTQVSVNDL